MIAISINAFTRLLLLGARLNQPLPLRCLSGWPLSVLAGEYRALTEALNQHHLYFSQDLRKLASEIHRPER
ncbi:hypothetical protein LGZ99_08555 [Photorhabdus temperata]|uniref:hypothetical protein n=1 Tax=Photorhabdus temperata TaxID=574560 RepID=UPI00040DF9EB|nr:hypothetical protein [Photorhabdus temperata]MCT8347257.1 hypothetical protein [Photorhabdus temperata]